MNMNRLLLAVLAVLALSVALTLAAPQAAQAAQGYIELDPIVVEGQIQRPEAAYIIQRANLEFGITAKKRSFVGKILTTINEAPF